MIEHQYGKVELPAKLIRALSLILAHYPIPKDAQRIALNCRDQRYHQQRQGLHPIEVQFERQSSTHWRMVFIASFSYLDKDQQTMDVELYFHLKHGWCYQPDINCELTITEPSVLALFNSWTQAICQHLISGAFDDIGLTLIR